MLKFKDYISEVTLTRYNLNGFKFKRYVKYGHINYDIPLNGNIIIQVKFFGMDINLLNDIFNKRFSDNERVCGVEFSTNGEYEITNSNNSEYIILSLVTQVISIESKNHDYIVFSADADEPSRVKLYDRIYKNITKFSRNLNSVEKTFNYNEYYLLKCN